MSPSTEKLATTGIRLSLAAGCAAQTVAVSKPKSTVARSRQPRITPLLDIIRTNMVSFPEMKHAELTRRRDYGFMATRPVISVAVEHTPVALPATTRHT